MRIENLRTEKKGGRSRVVATVTWEECDRPIQDVFFETEEEFASGLSYNPNAFLIGCIMPALQHGEERVFIDAEISPEIEEGLISAMALMRYWYYNPETRLPRIEAKTTSRISYRRTPERAGMFFSGGIDSLATIQNNRLNFSPEHPWSIKDALIVCGLEIDDDDKFQYVIDSMSYLTRDAQLTLIPIYTNIRSLDDNWIFWGHKFHDAVFSAIAHAFSQRLTVVSISSTYEIPHLQPFGTHPLLDIFYSSSDMLIRCDGIHLSKLAKTKLIADWDIALQNVRVCNQSQFYEENMLNCGKCIKCVRTMLSFMALGVLEKTRAFPAHNVSVGLLESTIKIFRTTICFYEELIQPLLDIGRRDLAHVIEKKIAEYRRRRERNNLKTSIFAVAKRFDSEYLHSNLVKIKRLISSEKNKGTFKDAQ